MKPYLGQSNKAKFRHTMHFSWYDSATSACLSTFGASRYTSTVHEILEHVFSTYSSKPPASASSNPQTIKYDNSFQMKYGFLATVHEQPQKPHTDYDLSLLTKFQKKSGCLPWLFDIGLTSGGLYLSFHGNASNATVKHKLLHVPQGHMLLWRQVFVNLRLSFLFVLRSSHVHFCHHSRGDGIHGGGFLGSHGENAFRVHGCVPLAKSHRGVGDEAMIYWNNGKGVSSEPYSRRLLRYDGSSFASPPNAVSDANVGATASINVLNSTGTSAACTDSCFLVCLSTCFRNVTAYRETNHKRGITILVRGRVIHHVAKPLATPPIVTAPNRLIKLFKKAEGIVEPNPIAKSPT
jgi:hypothetical protein